MKLTARIRILLDAPLHLANAVTKWSSDRIAVSPLVADDDIFLEPLSLVFELDSFALQIALHQELVDNPLLKRHQMPGVSSLTVKITKEIHDFNTADPAMYNVAHESYRKVLFVAAQRLIDYFKYELGNPFLRPLNSGHIIKWDWIDDVDNVLHTESGGCILAEFPGFPGGESALGSEALRRSDLSLLQQALQAPLNVSVVKELRAQAREAIFEGKLQLAVLLLAVSVEVAIKTTFFRGDTIASDAFDYLEEKRQVEISPVELINKVADRAFGQSFRSVDKNAYNNIEFLFQCRNKVAHRGKSIYRDSEQNVRDIDRDTLNDWWHSVEKLLLWLNAQGEVRRLGGARGSKIME